MPIKSGLDAVKKILKIDYQSKIIFISAEKNIRSKILSLGVSFVHKFLKKRLKKKNISNLNFLIMALESKTRGKNQFSKKILKKNLKKEWE